MTGGKLISKRSHNTESVPPKQPRNHQQFNIAQPARSWSANRRSSVIVPSGPAIPDWSASSFKRCQNGNGAHSRAGEAGTVERWANFGTKRDEIQVERRGSLRTFRRAAKFQLR